MTAAAFEEIANPTAGEVTDDLKGDPTAGEVKDLNSLVEEEEERLRADSLLDDLFRKDK